MNVLMLLAQGAMNMADSLATANPVLTPVSAPEMNMLDMAIKGGWIMIVLGVLSVVCFYILFERNYMIRKAGKEDPMFMERIKDYIHSGEIKAAIQYCRTMNTPSARMIEKGISRLGRPINDVQVAIENVGNLEVAKLEKGLTVMATISGGAPMLGFLGTVTGMVRAFYEMANAGSGNIDITLLSGGIYEAMITTVGGLIVGIIAMFAYNYLVMLVDRVVNKMEARTMEFILDVFETEPLPETSPLWNMENILITPHIAGPSFGGNAEVQDMIWNICMENLERYVNGKELKNIVRLKDGY